MTTASLDHRRIARALSLAVLGIALAASGIEAYEHRYAMARAIAIGRVTGYGAVACLAAALLATPALRALAWTPATRPSAAVVSIYRRALGTSAAWLALAHGAYMLGTYLDGAYLALVRPYLRAGAAATALLAVLLVTSFPSWVRVLRVRLWKDLHRAAYLAAHFVVLHLVLSPFAPKRETLGVAAAFGALWCLRFLPSPPRERRDRAPARVVDAPDSGSAAPPEV